MPRASASALLDAMKPMLLTPRKAVPRDAGWLAEIKFDGYRALASTGSAPSVRTKSGAACTAWFPELKQGLGALAAGCVLDGEICVLDSLGRADFERLYARAQRKRWYEGADPVVFCAFDLLVHHGRDVRQAPIEERKQWLRALMKDGGDQLGLLFVQALPDQAEWLYQQCAALNLEGVVCKRTGSTYQSGVRSPDWIKVKRPGVHEHGAFRRGP